MRAALGIGSAGLRAHHGQMRDRQAVPDRTLGMHGSRCD